MIISLNQTPEECREIAQVAMRKCTEALLRGEHSQARHLEQEAIKWLIRADHREGGLRPVARLGRSDRKS